MDLNIIGNGFDLYHGLPSSYYYFACYLIKRDPEFYFEMGRMYAFQTAVYSHIYEDCEPVVEYNLFWKDFEERLGQLDSIWLEESLIDDLDLEYPEDAIDIEIPETANSVTIIRYFVEWVTNTLETKCGIETIKKLLGNKKLIISDNSFFVNFNYTSILETIYGISSDNIFYIHNRVSQYEDSQLIVGHGNRRDIEGLKNKIEKIESETFYLSSQAERNRLNEYVAEKEILEDLLKDTDYLTFSLINALKNKSFDNIYIYGLSCGSVDMPYIKCIRKLYPDATWHFSYYNNNEKLVRNNLAKELLLPMDKVRYFLFKNDTAEQIKQKIISDLSIETYKTTG